MSGNVARISLLVHPNAVRSEVIGFANGLLKVKVAAPPVAGKANTELIAFLSRTLDVSKSAIAIVKGHTSRSKLVTIDGLSQEEVMKRLLPKPSSSAVATRTSIPNHRLLSRQD